MPSPGGAGAARPYSVGQLRSGRRRGQSCFLEAGPRLVHKPEAGNLDGGEGFQGTAYAAGAKADGDHLVFTVKLIVNNKAVSARIDGRTGRLSNPGPIANESQALLKDFAKAKKTLISAVRTAEASAKSKAFQARFKRQGNNALYEIDTAARDDVEKEIVIDAFSGKVRKVTEISSTSQADTGAQADVPAVAQ